MDYSDLIVNIREIPTDNDGIDDNLKRLLKHAEYLETIENIADNNAKTILEVAPPYIRKQIKRLQLHFEDEADIIAWISRCLMELLFMLRYMYTSDTCFNEVIKEQLKDLNDIEKIILPEGYPTDDSSEEIQSYHRDMGKLWDAMREYGINRDDLKKPNPAFLYAEGAKLQDDYRANWKIHSKYIHPTSYQLFGKKSFVYGDSSSDYFWVLAQYYAARNLRDMHVMIEKRNSK